MTELMWSLTDNLLVIVTPMILIVETRVMSVKGGGGSMGRRRLVREKNNFYAFSAIEMKVIVVGPGLDIIQFSGARKVI